MTYIKNTIARLEDWLNDLPQDSTSCKVSNRVELLNVDKHSPGARRIVGTLTKHYLEEAGYVVHVIDPFTITYNIEYFIIA